jgi:hypothetical protein
MIYDLHRVVIGKQILDLVNAIIMLTIILFIAAFLCFGIFFKAIDFFDKI